MSRSIKAVLSESTFCLGRAGERCAERCGESEAETETETPRRTTWCGADAQKESALGEDEGSV